MSQSSCCRPLARWFGWQGGGGRGGGKRDGLIWHMELKPHCSGEFSIAMAQANSSLEDQGQVLTSPFGTYVGVFDGHGGPEASRFANARLFRHLHKFASEQGGLSPEVMRKAFAATEEEFLHLVKESWLSQPQIASVGSCCLVGAITDDMIYVANLGDSRAVLGRRPENGKPAVAERLSSDHNVAVEEVRKELAELHPDDSHIVVYTRGVWRIKGIIQDHEPPQSNDNILGELGATSSINNGSISGDRINRLFSTSNGQLPATVLEARARFLERIRGITVSQNSITGTEDAGRNSLDSGRVRGISVTGTRRDSGSSSEDLLYDLAAVDGFVFQIRSQLASERDLLLTRGLSPEAIDNLLHEVFSEDEHGGDVGRQCDCSVCLESFNEGDGLLRLHCGHRFHCACLEPWLRTSGDCPYCRARI